jgi:hypothetical protein
VLYRRETPYYASAPLAPPDGVATDVRPNYKTSALSDYKTGGNAVILFRAFHEKAADVKINS